MSTEKDWNEPATPEQLELLRRLGVRLRINVEISRSLAQASIEFHQATARQLACLQRLGYEIDRPITKQQASELIGRHLASQKFPPEPKESETE